MNRGEIAELNIRVLGLPLRLPACANQRYALNVCHQLGCCGLSPALVLYYLCPGGRSLKPLGKSTSSHPSMANGESQLCNAVRDTSFVDVAQGLQNIKCKAQSSTLPTTTCFLSYSSTLRSHNACVPAYVLIRTLFLTGVHAMSEGLLIAAWLCVASS